MYRYIFVEGQTAYINAKRFGCPVKNPYPKGTEQHQTWIRGYLAERGDHMIMDVSFHCQY